MLTTADFALGVVIVGLSYALLVIFGMTSPFVIEHVYGFSPVISGYSSLLSGTAMMSGGIISKLLMNYPLRQKLYVAVTLQLLLAVTMLAAVRLNDNLPVLLMFTFSLHVGSGFIFNIIYAYCLQRFTQNAGIASGITGGGVYLISSLTNFVLTHLIRIDRAEPIVYANLIIITGLALVIPVFLKASFNLRGRQIQISNP